MITSLCFSLYFHSQYRYIRPIQISTFIQEHRIHRLPLAIRILKASNKDKKRYTAIKQPKIIIHNHDNIKAILCLRQSFLNAD